MSVKIVEIYQNNQLPVTVTLPQENIVQITQPLSSPIEVKSSGPVGPQGISGSQGPAGPQGVPGEDTSILSIKQVNKSNYTLLAIDMGGLIIMDSDTNVDFIILRNDSESILIGSQILISRQGQGEVTFTPQSGVTVNSAQGFFRLNSQYSGATLVKIDTDTWMLFGDLKA
jgi:hypothetical protein